MPRRYTAHEDQADQSPGRQLDPARGLERAEDSVDCLGKRAKFMFQRLTDPDRLHLEHTYFALIRLNWSQSRDDHRWHTLSDGCQGINVEAGEALQYLFV